MWSALRERKVMEREKASWRRHESDKHDWPTPYIHQMNSMTSQDPFCSVHFLVIILCDVTDWTIGSTTVLGHIVFCTYILVWVKSKAVRLDVTNVKEGQCLKAWLSLRHCFSAVFQFSCEDIKWWCLPRASKNIIYISRRELQKRFESVNERLAEMVKRGSGFHS